jgi:predicted TIM-barrel fold metal-dependent hydrolase
MSVHDVHCHFFSTRFFEALGAEKHRETPGVRAESVARELGWDAPGDDAALADRWARELEQNRVTRAALIASVPGDEESVARAVRQHPARFVGFFVINPLAPDAAERARHAFGTLGMRGACLFPALHRYHYDDDCVVKLFDVAAAHGGTVFAHCGYLSIEPRVRLGLPTAMDLRCGDPLALATTAVRFPGVPVIVPHFGGGFFREALMAAEAAPTIHFDTSSSNAWVKYLPGLTLTDVFRQALTVVGPDRLVFGTDSSFFPRGWRRVIMGAQRAVLGEIGLEQDTTEKIFRANFERLFGPAGVPIAQAASGGAATR